MLILLLHMYLYKCSSHTCLLSSDFACKMCKDKLHRQIYPSFLLWLLGPDFYALERSPLCSYRVQWLICENIYIFFLKKNFFLLLIELQYDPAIPFLDVYLKEMKALTWKYTRTTMLPEALFTTVTKWKQLKYSSTDEWIKDDMWYIPTMDYYWDIKKNEMFPFLTPWMDLEGIILSEVSQTKINTVYCHIYVKSKK